MTINGIFTNVGITKSIDAGDNVSYVIYPASFGVSDVSSGILDPSRTTPNTNQWYFNTISGRSIINNSSISVTCTIPPGVTTIQKNIREIYLYALDRSNNQFLLALGQPQTTIIYDPSGSTTLRLQLVLTNFNMVQNYSFSYTQTYEINQHNSDPNAHPEIQSALQNYGIFTDPTQNEFRGQAVDIEATFAPGTMTGDIVYRTLAGTYAPALADGTIASVVVGVANTERHAVYVNGLVHVENASFTPGKMLYLSPTQAGKVSLIPSSVPVGPARDSSNFILRVWPEPSSDYINVIVTDTSGPLATTQLRDAITRCPNNGWIRVDKMCSITSLVPLTTEGKTLNILFTGPRSGIEKFEGLNAIQEISFGSVPVSGTWRLTYAGYQTVDMDYNWSAGQVQAALNALPSVEDLVVTGNYSEGFTLEYTGTMGDQNVSLPTQPNTGINEVQRVSFDSVPNDGTFRLNFKGQITSPIFFTATASDVQAALSALSTVNQLTVTGTFASGFMITFLGPDGLQNQPQTVIASSSLNLNGTPTNVQATTVTEGLTPDDNLRDSTGSIVSINISTSRPGQLPGTTTGLLIDAPNVRVFGMGVVKGFDKGIDLGNQQGCIVEMRFEDTPTPIEYGILTADQYETEGCLGLSDFTFSEVTNPPRLLPDINDQTLGRKLAWVDVTRPTPDTKVSISPAYQIDRYGSKYGLIIDEYVSGYLGGTVDFSTGVVTGGGSSFTPYTPSTAGNYFKYGIILDIDDKIRVISPSGDGETPSFAPSPKLLNGLVRAIVTVKDSGNQVAGSIEPVEAEHLMRFNTEGTYNKTAVVESIKVVSSSGQSSFNFGSFTFDESNSVYDLIIDVNGRRVHLDTTGSGTVPDTFIKTGSNSIQFSSPIPQDAVVSGSVNSFIGGSGFYGGGGGDPTTFSAANLGTTGIGLYSGKIGNSLQFRRINAGAGIILNEYADHVDIVASSDSDGGTFGLVNLDGGYFGEPIVIVPGTNQGRAYDGGYYVVPDSGYVGIDGGYF